MLQRLRAYHFLIDAVRFVDWKAVERNRAHGVGDIDGIEISSRAIPLHQRIHQTDRSRWP